jgi:Flp pilus assembly protein TadB
MFSSQILVVLGALVVTLLAWLVGPPAIGRSLKIWELAVIAAVALGLLQWQRQRRLRRDRQALESIRDSALW